MTITIIESQYTKKIVTIPFKEEYLNLYMKDKFIVFLNEDGREELGEILFFEKEEKIEELTHPESDILRNLTENDKQKIEGHKKQEEKAFNDCETRINEHKLEMKLLEAIYSFDGGKINFIFTAEDRVDFRELVKDLAKTFQKQIRLQQIGPRDKARIIKGYGKCGRHLCCTHFLKKLESVTMDMVRAQNMINKGTTKLSGTCGKLMCCLAYEVEEYEKLRKELPEQGSFIKTKKIEGQVIGVDILNQLVKVHASDRSFQTIPKKDIISVVKRPPRDNKEKSNKHR